MRYEPSINRTDLLNVVYTSYGLEVEEIQFVPVGYVAACYSLRCLGGDQYFLKLWPNTKVGRVSAARQEIILPLTRALYERGILQRVAYPLATRDHSLWTHFQGEPFAVFPFLPGYHPSTSVWTMALRGEFACTLAAIHQGTSLLADVLPPRETFTLSFTNDLQSSFKTIVSLSPQARPGLHALRKLLLLRGDEIRAQLGRLRHLQAKVHTLPGTAVLCHTDLTSDNLLVNDQGHLYVLDWDEAVVATPEYDLKEAVGDGFDRFLQVYVASGGEHTLEIDRFAFYLLRRYFEDLMARLTSILQENTTEEQDQDALEGMERWGFARWNRLDATLASIKPILSQLHR